MKKYLSLLLIIILLFTFSCKKEKEKGSEEPVEFETVEFSGKHEYSLLSNNIYSYMIYKAKPSSKGLLQSLTFYSFIIKNDIENRDYEYFQVDYSLKNATDTVTNTYYHIFDSQDDPKGLYAQNFMPYINIYGDHLMDKMQALIKYSYDQDKVNVKKEVTYAEEVIKYNLNDEYKETLSSDFNVVFYETDNSTVENKSYKLIFNFDDKLYTTGHFDFQVFLEIDGEVLPFYGVYNYPVRNGSFITISDEKIEATYDITKVYWNINHYDEDGKLTNVLYKENFQ